MTVFNSIMEIYKSIRKSKGWTPYKMAKALRISQTQLSHYEKMPISQREMLLVRMQELSGLTLSEFWEVLKEEARVAEKKKLKAIIDEL